jgi:hypothetical protein
MGSGPTRAARLNLSTLIHAIIVLKRKAMSTQTNSPLSSIALSIASSSPHLSTVKPAPHKSLCTASASSDLGALSRVCWVEVSTTVA